MAEMLAEHPDVNIVYAINEPAALGALDALESAELDLDRTVPVSIDGGCRAIKDAVRPGDVDATAMQFPQNMAREGVRALAAAARGGDARQATSIQVSSSSRAIRQPAWTPRTSPTACATAGATERPYGTYARPRTVR